MRTVNFAIWSLMACFIFLGCGGDASDESRSMKPSTADDDEPDLSRGKALYEKYCDFCHGADGEGYLADNANALSNQSFLAAARSG